MGRHMVSYSQARKIAEAWVEVMTNGGAAVYHARTRMKPYGWLFCWNSKQYLADPSNEEAALIGNVPIFVDRINGEVLCTSPRINEWFSQYEASIPKARLEMVPELPGLEGNESSDGNAYQSFQQTAFGGR